MAAFHSPLAPIRRRLVDLGGAAFFPAVLVVFLGLNANVAFAQNAGGDIAAGGGQTNAGQAGGQRETTIATPDDAFAGSVDRSGAVGQNTGAAVGTNAATQNAGRGGGAGGGFGGLGGGLGAAFGSLFGGGGNTNSSATPAIRTRLRSAIAVSPVSSVNTQATVQRTLATAGPAAVGPYRGVNVQMDGRRAIVRGTVRSNADRRMAELLLRLEPGVSSVDNQVQIAPLR